MNEEIKEILDFKENGDYKRLSIDEIIVLKDYITNLQDADKDLRTSLSYYLSIIDKANTYVTYLGLKCKYRLNTGHLRKLKKILQGVDEI